MTISRTNVRLVADRRHGQWLFIGNSKEKPSGRETKKIVTRAVVAGRNDCGTKVLGVHG